MKRIVFVVTPVAGRGGRGGLKGTDGLADQARALGAEPVSPKRTSETLMALRPLPSASQIHWITGAGVMGPDPLAAAGFPRDSYEIALEPPRQTSAEHTKDACRAFERRDVELIVFCGGAGTCRDVIDSA